MKNTNARSEGDFRGLLQEFLDGLRSIDDLVASSEFKKKLRIFCYSFHFIAGWTFGPEDLIEESSRKVLLKAHKLSRYNTPNEYAFFGWLNTLVRNTFLDELRKYERREGVVVQIDQPLEELEIAAPGENLEGKQFLNLFLKFVEPYSDTRKHVLALWLQGCSYSEIQKDLIRMGGPKVSRVTIGNWVNNTLHDFRRNLGVPDPAPQRKGLAKQKGA
jgi:DNA-directed RNA polymerase specialized sigma24 family protein